MNDKTKTALLYVLFFVFGFLSRHLFQKAEPYLADYRCYKMCRCKLPF